MQERNSPSGYDERHGRVVSDNRAAGASAHIACLHYHHDVSNLSILLLTTSFSHRRPPSDLPKPGCFHVLRPLSCGATPRHTPFLLPHHHDHNSHPRITIIMVGAPSAAASLVGFLSEPDTALQVFALDELNKDMDNIWTEVSGSIGQMCAPSKEIFRRNTAD